MIDNLISDPMKQIWISLEFYYESMDYLIFRDFLYFFLKIKSIYLIKIDFRNRVGDPIKIWSIRANHECRSR